MDNRWNLYAGLSAFGGCVFAVLSYLFCLVTQVLPEPLEICLFAGAVFALALFPVLIWSEKSTEKKYKALEETMGSAVFCKANGNFYLEKGVRNGNLYFCEDGVLLASLNDKPAILEQLPIEKIAGFQFDGAYFVIHTVDEQNYIAATKDADTIRAALTQKGWILE